MKKMYREGGGSMTSLVLLLVLLSTTNSSGPAGGDETDLATRRSATHDSGGLTDVLMVTTTVGMLNGVHGHTTDLGPAVTLDLVLVVGATGLQHGLVDTSTTGDDADGSPVGGGDDLLGAGRQLYPGLLGVRIVGDDGGVVSRSTGDTAAVSGLLLQVGDDGTFGHLSDWHHVAHSQLGLLSAVDELSSVHTFGGNEQLLPGLVAVGVTEVDDGQGGATTGVVDDVLYDTLDVAITLGVVDRTELGSALAVLNVGLEDRPSSLPLGTDHTTHPYSAVCVLIRSEKFPTRYAEKT